jgi:hypothetical protein
MLMADASIGMQKKAFDLFVRRIIALGHQIETPFVSGELDILRMWITAGRSFSLPPAGMSEYGALIRDLPKTQGWSARFSPAYIQERVKSLLETVYLGNA